DRGGWRAVVTGWEEHLVQGGCLSRLRWRACRGRCLQHQKTGGSKEFKGQGSNLYSSTLPALECVQGGEAQSSVCDPRRCLRRGSRLGCPERRRRARVSCTGRQSSSFARPDSRGRLSPRGSC